MGEPQRVIPAPEPHGPGRAIDDQPETARRAGLRAHQQRRSRIDSLAVGSPLAAAFVGILVGELAGAAESSPLPAGGATAPTSPGSTAGTTGAGAAQRTLPGEGEASAALTSPSEASLASASVSSAHGLAGTAGGGSGGTWPAAERAAVPDPSAAVTAKASVSAAPSYSYNFGSANGYDQAAAFGSGQAPGGPGTIGSYVTGTDGDDVITGTDADDSLFGGDGNDTIYGLAGDDLLDGGTGHDRLYGGEGDDDLFGRTGDDMLAGGPGNDDLDGGAGDDDLFGNDGRDRLVGGPGDDLLDGGPGADRMEGGSGADTLTMDSVADVPLEGGGSGSGNDTLIVQAAYADGLPGEGTATFVLHDEVGAALPVGADSYRQQVDPDIENIELRGSAGHAVVGNGNANSIVGNSGDNALAGGGGRDTVFGGAGNDQLFGNAGDDILRGGQGDDRLLGGSNDDILRGGAGDDWLAGGQGEDLLYGQAGNDTYQVGLNDSAIDTIFDHEGANAIEIAYGGGHQVETAVAGDDLYVVVDKNPAAIVDDYLGHEDAFAGIDSGRGAVEIDDLMAPNAGNGPALGSGRGDEAPSSSHDDILAGFYDPIWLRGSANDDFLAGTGGADRLNGLDGDDHLRGGDGDDLLVGGRGRDILEGGAGGDHYVFKPGEADGDLIRDAFGTNTVHLREFEPGTQLRGVVDSNGDLMVVGDNSHLFTIERFAGNQEHFAGIRIGDEFLSAEDLIG